MRKNVSLSGRQKIEKVLAFAVLFLVSLALAGGGGGGGGGGGAPLYGEKSAVIQLSADNFTKVLKSNAVWLVEFYAPWCGHCKSLAPEWEKAGKALKGVAKIAAVDAEAHAALGTQYGVQGFPTIKVFGANKKKPTDYTGGRKAEDIVAEVLKITAALANGRLGKKPAAAGDGGAKPSEFYAGTDVVDLTDATFESDVLKGSSPWLVEFYAPWCGHCKNLTPEWKKAATELKASGVKVGAIDATVHKTHATKYDVKGFPTIKYFPGGSPKAEDYSGARTSTALVEFAKSKAKK